MKNTFQKAIAATALLALGFAAAPVFADDAADKVTAYIEAARGVFGGDKTAADAVSETLAASADKVTAGEIAAAVAAAQVAKDDAGAESLAGIAGAAGDFASRAAATVAAVTGVDFADSLEDPAVADAAKDPDSVLTGADKADLKDLYEKVLAALKGSGYKMKEDGDKASVGGKGKGKGKKGKGKGGDDAAAAAAAGSGAEADGSSGSSAGGSDGASADGSDGASAGDAAEDVVYGDDENLGDPLDQTFDPVPPAVDPDDPTPPYGPHEYHTPPTTLSGIGHLPPVTPTTSKPKHTKPSPTPVGLR